MYARLRHLGSTLFILGVSITALSFVVTSGRKAAERGPSGDEENAALPRLRLLSLALLSVRMERRAEFIPSLIRSVLSSNAPARVVPRNAYCRAAE